MRIQHLKIDMLPSLNDYAHYQRVRRSTRLRRDVWAQIKAQKIVPIEAYPVDVELIGYFVGRGYDRTNLAGPWKIVEDVMVEGYILRGDSEQYIGELLYRRNRRSVETYSYLEITLIEGAGGFEVRM